MKKINGIDNFSLSCESIITIGTFDGVHKGHQKILKKIVDDSKKLNLKSIVLTFFPHPRTVLNPKTPLKLINTIDERKSHFENLGIDILITHPFDKNFSELSPEEFVRDILITKLNVKKILIGYDHRFGKNRVAGIDDLKKLALKYKFDVNEISVEEQNNVSISSTKIRNSINEGKIEIAKSFLGYNYTIKGKVIKGNMIGRTLGFPTANLEIKENYKLLPKNGVYLIYTLLEEQIYYGMMNIGIKPTLKSNKQTIEVNLFGWEKDIYDQSIQIFVLKFIRDEKKFSSLNKLTNQIKIDKKTCLEYIKKK